MLRRARLLPLFASAVHRSPSLRRSVAAAVRSFAPHFVRAAHSLLLSAHSLLTPFVLLIRYLTPVQNSQHLRSPPRAPLVGSAASGTVGGSPVRSLTLRELHRCRAQGRRCRPRYAKNSCTNRAVCVLRSAAALARCRSPSPLPPRGATTALRLVFRARSRRVRSSRRPQCSLSHPHRRVKGVTIAPRRLRRP